MSVDKSLSRVTVKMDDSGTALKREQVTFATTTDEGALIFLCNHPYEVLFTSETLSPVEILERLAGVMREAKREEMLFKKRYSEHGEYLGEVSLTSGSYMEISDTPDKRFAFNCNEVLAIEEMETELTTITFTNGMQETVELDYQTVIDTVWGNAERVAINATTEGIAGCKKHPATNRTCEMCNSLLTKALSFAQELQESHQSQSEAVNKLLAQMGSKQEGC